MSSKAKLRNVAHMARAELGLVFGVITTIVFFTIGKAWIADLDNFPQLIVIFCWILCVMVWCAFRVVHHAEGLAELLGEPYGTLILTISVISIEVTILASIMLIGEPNPTLPRDTMFAILMIVLNGMVGLTLTVGALRHGQQQYNLEGAIAFLAVLSPLAVIALVVPEFNTAMIDPAFTPLQATVFAVLTALLYSVFLLIQTSRHRTFFTEPQHAPIRGRASDELAHRPSMAVKSVIFHAALLIATLIPVVLLAKPLATLLNFGIEQVGIPEQVGAILIAMLILAPESVAALQAAARNHLQRAINLSLGSALSTIGLTVPVVLAISVVIGMPLDLGLTLVEIVLLVLTLFVCKLTFSGAPTNVLLGAVHLCLFAAYLMIVLEP